MPRLAAAIAMVIATAAAANAQQLEAGAVLSFTMGELASQGFEIKAAAQNGSRYVVFMQNDKSAYACEFVNVTTTRCRQIN
ncbi:hypothetical protein [Shinella pollutisoli]|uniref:Uncharacterized protein n=1 Tax=Shinella pollutisoli TaxID=2250594 RepID=A0ABV7DBI6_9HYPH|nr:hypothetical protein [Shinella pollutisoli]